MNWYIAKIVYQIICGEGNHRPQFDEQLRLISANNSMHAFHKAREMGKREEDCFLNNVNKPVNWKFIDVAEILPLNVLADGAEMYSKICEEDDAERYIHTVKLRAAHLCENSTYEVNSLN